MSNSLSKSLIALGTAVTLAGVYLGPVRDYMQDHNPTISVHRFLTGLLEKSQRDVDSFYEHIAIEDSEPRLQDPLFDLLLQPKQDLKDKTNVSSWVGISNLSLTGYSLTQPWPWESSVGRGLDFRLGIRDWIRKERQVFYDENKEVIDDYQPSPFNSWNLLMIVGPILILNGLERRFPSPIQDHE